MDTATAVLDIGKTNLKLAAVSPSGQILDIRTTANVWRPSPPYPHVNVERIWRWLLDGLASLGSNISITAIVTVTHGATAALINRTGLILPILDYEYSAVAEEDDAYEAIARDFGSTFSPRLPAGLNLGRQLYWQQQRLMGAFSRARSILTYPQYWTWRLSGVRSSEITSLGCHTDLWQPTAETYSIFADASGMARLFPPLRPAWETVGHLRPEIARSIGLPTDCRVINGIHDSNASFLRHLSVRLGRQFTVVSTGTWIVVMASGTSLECLDGEADMLANVDATGAPIACARFMGGREYELISRGGDGKARRADVQRAIDDGTMALPAFTDQGGPYRTRVGRIIGPNPERPAARAALASLYCALITDDCLSRLDARGDVIIEGPFAGNAAYCGILAALRPRHRVYRSEDATGTMVGAALLAHWPAQDRSPLKNVSPWRLHDIERYKRNWISGIVGPVAG